MINSVVTNRPNPAVNPDEYAKQYAAQNGITVEEAKAELKAQFGDPVKPEGNEKLFSEEAKAENKLVDTSALEDFDFVDIENLDTADALVALKNMFQKIMTLLKNGNGPRVEGDPQFKEVETTQDTKKERLPESKADRDKYAQEYADKNGITLDEAKEILKSKEPSKNSFTQEV